MKTQQCPACGHKINLKQAAEAKKLNGIFMLQCANCKQWSHENRKAAIVKNVGLILMLTGSVMGYFQLGGIIIGPIFAFTGGLIALATQLAVPRKLHTP
ncbi:CpXC domain-containing protein [Rheinheimera hassiensis]|uniref:CpXC domain-containing protein n=1 Tax=Rheinheimera hassiensis TaxID=1193627 RepID=UPI001F058815|nr:CpXC domain-containing protein [Rheinheimera hassiensis]